MLVNVLSAIDKVIDDGAKKSDRDYTHFHPSEWDGCKRKTAYAYYESKGFIKINENALKINTILQRCFDNGHYMHDRWRKYLEKTGSLMGTWVCVNANAHPEGKKKFTGEGKIGTLKPNKCECGSTKFYYEELGHVDIETMWGGHVDAIVDNEILSKFLGSTQKILEDEKYIIVDFKSMSTFQFKTLESPMPKHITQIQIYLYLFDIKYAKFIYEDKNSQTAKEFLVTRDEKLIDIKKQEAIQLKHIINNPVNGKHKLPIRGYATKTHRDCVSCKFRGHCWQEQKQPKKELPTSVSQLVVTKNTTQDTVLAQIGDLDV